MKYLVVFFFLPSLCFALATSDTYQVENEMPIAGGGRQTSDSFTNIGAVGQNIVPVRASSDSYLADFGMAFWNAGSVGTLTVTDSSNNASSAEFTLSYASADPDSPLFMACYGTTQADVDNSCVDTATRAFTSAFSYEITGLLNNTTYYFKIYPLSGYDASGNPAITTRSSNTVSSSRAQGTVFLPVSSGSGSGGSMPVAPSPSFPTASAQLPLPAPSVFEQVTDFIASVFSPEPVPPVVKNVIVNDRLPAPAAMPSSIVSVVPLAADDIALPLTPAFQRTQTNPQTASIEGVVFGTKGARSVPLSGTRITLYECPSPAARPTGCTVWRPAKGQANPVLSDSRGTFSFDVPAGIYYFKVVKTGYEAADSAPFPVAVVRYARIDMKPVSLLKKLFGWW